MLPCGDWSGNLYIERAPGNTYITRGPFKGPKGRRKAAGRHPWIPYGTQCIYLRKSSKKNRAVLVRLPGGYRAGTLCTLCDPPNLSELFSGCRFDENANEFGTASSTHRHPHGLLKLSGRP